MVVITQVTIGKLKYKKLINIEQNILTENTKMLNSQTTTQRKNTWDVCVGLFVFDFLSQLLVNGTISLMPIS